MRDHLIQPGPLGLAPTPEVEDGTLPRFPAPRPDTGARQARAVEALEAGREVVRRLGAEVDRIQELRGAGVALCFPDTAQRVLRPSRHASGLGTWLVLTPALEGCVQVGAQALWWECLAELVLLLGEGPAAGKSRRREPFGHVLARAGEAARALRIGLAVAQVASGEFREYLRSKRGEWIHTADAVLDVIAHTGDVRGALDAVRSGSALFCASRLARKLGGAERESLAGTLARLEQTCRDLAPLEGLLGAALGAGRRERRAGAALRRALPLVTGRMRRDALESFAAAAAEAFSSLLCPALLLPAGCGPGPECLRVAVDLVQEGVGDAKQAR